MANLNSRFVRGAEKLSFSGHILKTNDLQNCPSSMKVKSLDSWDQTISAAQTVVLEHYFLNYGPLRILDFSHLDSNTIKQKNSQFYIWFLSIIIGNFHGLP